MKTTDQLGKMYDELLELHICTSGEAQLITNINGYNEQALNDIVYARTGYQDLGQYQQYQLQD